MPQLTAPQIAKLQAENHQITPYLSFLKPRTLWTARVNNVPAAQGDISIPFDGGSGSAFAAVEAFQEVWVGTSAGDNDLGYARIRGITSGDGGVTGTLSVAKSPTLWQDDAYLTFRHDYPLRPLRPRIATDETFYKDYDVAFNWPPTPVCVAGPHRAQFLTGASLVFAVNLSSSYAIASGATISSYAASVYPTTGVTVSVNSGTGIGTITFTQTGQYWAKFSCTDSNGKVQTTFRCYFVASTDPTHEDFPLVDFELSEMMGTYESGGWDAGFSVHNGPTLADIPDRTLAIMWGSWKYDDVFGPVAFGPNNDNSILVGYVRQDNYSKDMGTGEQPVRFKMSTAQGVMGQKYNFSISLEAVQGTPDAWWKYDNTLTVGKGIHHLLAEHSTVLECADVIGLTDVGTLRAYVEIPDNDIFGAGNALSSQRGSREHLVCDRYGRIYFKRNQQLLSDADRAGLTTVGEITTTDRSLLEVSREQEKQVCFTHVSGFVWNGTFDAEGAPDAQPVCAVAPGDDPEEDGPKVERVEYQTFASQNEANDVAGRVHSAANNPFKELEVTFHGNYLGVVEIANGEQWEISLLTTETPREIVLTNRKIYPRLVQISIIDGVATVTVTFESEAPPLAGKTTDCPTLPFIDGDWDLPAEDSLGGALVTAGSVKFKSPLGNSWATRYSGAVSDMAADPYWQSKQNSDASNDAILMIGGVGYIRRSTDAGQNWSVVTPGTNPPNTFGDSPAPTATTVDYMVIEPNEGVEDNWLALARWQNSSDEWRSWVAYSTNNGTSWSWVDVGGGTTSLTVPGFNALTTKNHADSPVAFDMGNDRLIIVYATSTPHYIVTLIDTINGTILDTDGSGGSLLAKVVAATKLTSSRMIIVSEDQDAGALVFSLLEIQSDTLVSLANQYHASYGSNFPTALSVARRADNAWVTALNRNSSGTARGILIACTFDGVSTITVGSETEFNAEATPYLAVLEGVLGTHLYWQDNSLTDLRAMMITGSGTTINTNSEFQVLSNSVSFIGAAIVSGDKAVVAYADSADSNNLWARAITLGTGSSTLGTDAEIKNAAVTAVYVVSSGTDQGYISYRHGTNTLSHTSFTVSGHAITPGSESDFDWVGGYPVMAWISAGLVEAAYDANDVNRLKAKIPGSGAIKGLGLSIGRAVGETAYVTGWSDAGNLVLIVFDVPTMTNLGETSLGAATLEQVDNRELTAWPFAPWGFLDDFAWIYGRMSSPGNLSGIQHVVYTADAGLSFVEFENTFGDSHCASLLESYGTLHVLVSTASQTKLYTGSLTDGLALKSTLPIPGFAWPHGQTFDWLEQIIYVGTGVAGAVAVVKSDFPYGEWQDITYDHGATAIKSIIIL